MLANFRLNYQTNLITAAFILLALLSVRDETLADETVISPENPWLAMTSG